MSRYGLSLEWRSDCIRICEQELLHDYHQTIILEEKILPFNVYSILSKDIDLLEKSIDILENYFSSLNIKTNEATIIIPDTNAYISIISLSEAPENEIIEIIKNEEHEIFPVNPESLSIDIECLYKDENTKKMSFLIVAMLKNTAHCMTYILNGLGIEINRIESEISTFGRIATRPQIFNHCLFGLSVGVKNTSLYLVDTEKNFLFYYKNIEYGFENASLEIFENELLQMINQANIHCPNLPKHVFLYQYAKKIKFLENLFIRYNIKIISYQDMLCAKTKSDINDISNFIISIGAFAL